MNRKAILFFVLGWLLAVVVAPRDLLSKLRG
jgi:hypothetical protein